MPSKGPAGPQSGFLGALTRLDGRDSGHAGRLIRAYRTAAGLSQRRLADTAGVSVGVIRDLEQGRTAALRGESAQRILCALHLTGDQASELSLAAHGRTRAPGAPAAPTSGRGARSGDSPRLSVLGPLAAWRGAVQLALGTGIQPAVLGLLTLHPNTPVYRQTIIEALWGDGPPASAVTQVQSQVSRLRRMLDPGREPRDSAGLMLSFGTSYMLQATAGQLDLLAFRDRISRARANAGRGELAAACRLFEQALGLWRGGPLAGVRLLEGHPAVSELAAQRTELVMEYADAAFGAGLHESVLPFLRTVTESEPLNEKVQAQLMTALAATGQQAAALAIFEGLRRRLNEELGIYPGADLAEAHAQVLRQDLPRAAAHPTAGRALPRPRQNDEKTAPEGDETAAYAVATAAHLPVCQLPPAMTDFTGRASEVMSLTRLLVPGDGHIGVPMAVISGPPGVGKTALALRVAHTVRPSFPDGQLYVQLDGSTLDARNAADALGELLRALGTDGSAIPPSTGERAALFRSQTAGRKILLMADDAAFLDQVRPLLPGTAGCAIIVTSRSRLGGLAGAHLLPLDPLPHGDAAEMLRRVVGRDRVAADAEASDRLVSACGGLPLALRIAGAKLATRPSWPVAMVAEAVADERRRLDELAVDDLAFRASIMPSYEALDERVRRAFRRLGLLESGNFAEWVVAALLGEPDAADVVNLLVDRSLLTPVGPDGTGEPRYKLHDLLHDYAAERLADEPERERDAALLRALKGWREIAAAADHRLPRVPSILRPAPNAERSVVSETLIHRLSAQPIAWFTAERLNLAAATKRACTIGKLELAEQVAGHQATFQFFQARLDDADRLWRLVIATAESAGNASMAARAELQQVQVMTERGENAEAVAMLDRCIPVLEALGDEQALGLGLHWRAHCAEQQNLLHEAKRDARRGLAIARKINDSHAESSNLRVLGLATTRLGDHDAGVQRCQEAMALARQMKEPYAEFETLQTLAYTNILAGRHTAAINLCRQGVEMAHRLGYPAGEAYVLGPLGDAYNALGRYQDAIDALSRAQQIFRGRGLRRADALCLLKLAFADQALGRYEQAAHKLKESLPTFRELNLSAYEQRALRALEQCGDHSADDEHPDG